MKLSEVIRYQAEHIEYTEAQYQAAKDSLMEEVRKNQVRDGPGVWKPAAAPKTSVEEGFGRGLAGVH